jgi:hypothetical protein
VLGDEGYMTKESDIISSSKTAWLIEAPGVRYLEAYEMSHSCWFRWTTDQNKAIQFVDEKQADMTMMALRQLSPSLFGFAATLGMSRPVEHLWVGAK